MDELLFPAAALGGVFLIVVPVLTVVSRAVLARRRAQLEDWASFGSDSTWAWLVAPTLLPVAWLVSSVLHQIEPSAVERCFIDHVEAAGCIDAVLLLGLLISGGALAIASNLRQTRCDMRFERLGADHPDSRRVASLLASEPLLASLRVDVVEHAPVPVGALGLWKSRIILDACFVRACDDGLLRAALLHELAHVTGRDTLRVFMARLCLSLNPLGHLLVVDFEHWRGAREALCDSEAVALGGDPLALAEGIVRAARFRCSAAALRAVALLCGHQAGALKLRLNLLLAEPKARRTTRGHLILLILLVATVAMPHLGGPGLLEHFHFEIERIFHTLLRG